MKSSELIKLLESNGWVLTRTRGSHHQFKHKDHSKVITVPHPKKDLGNGLIKKIMQDAGL